MLRVFTTVAALTSVDGLVFQQKSDADPAPDYISAALFNGVWEADMTPIGLGLHFPIEIKFVEGFGMKFTLKGPGLDYEMVMDKDLDGPEYENPQHSSGPWRKNVWLNWSGKAGLKDQDGNFVDCI